MGFNELWKHLYAYTIAFNNIYKIDAIFLQAINEIQKHNIYQFLQYVE